MSGIFLASIGATYSSAPVNTAVPVISGTVAIGNTLTCSTGTWTGKPTPTYTYQWQRGTTNISGATSNTYVVQLSDASNTLRCTVTATNSVGTATATSANTLAVPAPSIGQAVGGGYYAGKIVENSVTYYVIVAPKATGVTNNKAWKTTSSAGPAATITLNNGPAASASMNSTTYPAARFCELLSIGGYTDWYLPSRDELELFWRNLKPISNPINNTDARSKSSYTYPEGNDVSGDTMGINRNSSPTGYAYTSSNPGLTPATNFYRGGSEALNEDLYWSSSEFNSSQAWGQKFNDGAQIPVGKDLTGAGVNIRAVRRVAE